MSHHDIAVSVRDLSKSYTIAHNAPKHTTLGEAVAHTLKGLRGSVPASEKETFWALKDVEFDIKKGDVVGIIGRNGAGKSTLLKVLSRITEPTTGQIDIYGRVGSLLEVGTGFHPELTGRENIYMNGAILGMSKREITKHFDEIVAFAEVEQFLDTPVKRYSSGMYVRLAFAVAAHLNPQILIIDEVLAVGDAAFQKKCLGKMQDVAQKEGRTVVFVSHTMSAIQTLCSKAVMMQSGRLVEYGPTEKVISGYMSDSYYSEDGDYDLTEHPARSVLHKPIIHRIKMMSRNYTARAIFDPDEALIVELSINPSTPIREPRAAVAIEDQYGRRIMTVASYFNFQDLAEITTECRLRCILPKINLGTGRYLISVSISDKYHGLLDSVDNAAWFEVGWNNNYNNGEPYHPVYGPVIAEASWERVAETAYSLAVP